MIEIINNEFAKPLEVDGLRVGYAGHAVLNSLSFSIENCEIRVILGASGCGKSTLLNSILGLERAMAGRVRFFGHELQAGHDAVPEWVRARTGVLFQNGALLSSLTVAQNVALPIRMHKPTFSDQVIDEMVMAKLESVGMLDAWHKLPAELSGGMRKRAALARALALDPGILFCDEPSAGLDPVTSRHLDELLLELRDKHKIAILVVTHELASIRAIADKVLFLAQGRAFFDGTLAEAEREDSSELASFFGRAIAPAQAERKTVSFVIGESHGNH